MEIRHLHMREGIWEGVVTLGEGADPVPLIEVSHLGKPLENVELFETDSSHREWGLRFPIPAVLLADGMQTILMSDGRTGETLASYSILAGQVLDDDFRAELDLLREELDMLKRAFRRHCLEVG